MGKKFSAAARNYCYKRNKYYVSGRKRKDGTKSPGHCGRLIDSMNGTTNKGARGGWSYVNKAGSTIYLRATKKVRARKAKNRAARAAMRAM